MTLLCAMVVGGICLGRLMKGSDEMTVSCNDSHVIFSAAVILSVGSGVGPMLIVVHPLNVSVFTVSWFSQGVSDVSISWTV